MEDYSVLKRNEVSSHGKTGRKLKCNPNQMKQPEKVMHPVIATIWYSGRGKAMKTVR